MGVDLIVETGGWNEAALQRLAAQAFAAVAASFNWQQDTYEVAVLACDDARIAALNGDFRGKPKATNVLSWPSAERNGVQTRFDDPELGDIAIAFETVVREAKDQGKTFEDHVLHLFVHAMLHLLGFDHETAQDAAVMEAKEVEILAKIGVADPYCATG